MALFPLTPQHHSSEEDCPTLVNTQGSTPYHITGVPRQRNVAQMKEQIKTPEKELSNEEIANLSDAASKTLIIRMLREMIEHSHLIKEVKGIQSEIKENIQGTNSEGMEMRTQMNNLEQKEEINFQLEQNEETKIEKNDSGTTLNLSTSKL